MKRIPYVPDVTMTDILGEIVYLDQSGRPMQVPKGAPTKGLKPWIISQYEFMVGRFTDTKYTAPREGLDAIEFKHEARKELTDQRETAPEKGGWDLEDDRAKAVQAVILRPTNGYNSEFEHNFLPFGVAARDMKDAPRELKKTNGASPETGEASV